MSDTPSLARTGSERPTRVAVAIVAGHGGYLVGVRPAGAALAGMSEFPGGKLRAEETPEQAAERECLEETGIPVRAMGILATVVERYPHGLVEVNFVDCQPLEITANPRAPFRWIAVADLASLEFPKANEKILQRLVRSTSAR